jgi:hypothetical protein
MRDRGFGSAYPLLLSTGSGGWRVVVVRLDVPLRLVWICIRSGSARLVVCSSTSPRVLLLSFGFDSGFDPRM